MANLDEQEKIKRLIEACVGVGELLECSTDGRERQIAYRKKIEAMSMAELKADSEANRPERDLLPADRLRAQADEIERKDALIREFRAALSPLTVRADN